MSSITLPTSLASTASVLVRSHILTQHGSWRPFAYSFTGDANLLLASNAIVENPLAIHAAFSSLDYSSFGVGSENEIREIRYDIPAGTQLTGSQIIANATTNTPIATAQDATSITVRYIYALGSLSEQSNRLLVPDNKQTVVFASRHTDVEDCSFRLTDNGNGTTTITFPNTPAGYLEKACADFRTYFSL